ncbi:cell wall metabolism sensor histidine kinase WalK [Ligilactobacillus agilis]|jgi:two-component system, OmpR family, sensor histidine kinase VicK|uniref:histidine kinase n=1 Tax=Ligilactobacillus agilis TaxID=1601 RepID=A0A222W6D0_9LACO|nr:cell wall metabolism sensor histidine kinase WalK [Ligilactobacillus agilis]ASR41718.1 PAS domain-containing sensor histidine kinase [Ligilactobacillus agilis]MBM6764109.1 cell wall metabolism sensor histidine kinase WalK [Ligilactobacillus agilis]MDO4455641.1 cell wall metabolism sensor histidine kinase WalK [Ligilactobacillus agilis]MDO4597581.1 cell wall metabolism sensor histidine kinase WalK [Ligilactobacillus agilis]NJE31888.1 cell wall metabolism sensor histidine kinase WalK [Ligilac
MSVNKKLRFFQSIHFKIALVFALLLLITFQIVGAVFVQQLKSDNIKAFKQRVELSTYVDNSLIASLNSSDTAAANQKIRKVLEDINNENISEIQVVDVKGTIRGDSDVNNRSLVGQKTTDAEIKQVIYNSRSFTKTTYDKRDNRRYYIAITPLLSVSGNTNTVVGAVYVKANMETVYDSINSVVVIFATASLIATAIGMALAIVISRAITRPIDEMKKQTSRIARGDYSGQVRIYGQDELGQLAQAVNNLSVKIEEAQESSEAERRRLDSVLSHMSDGVIATDRRGNITIINEMASEDLNVNPDEVIGRSILDVLDIRSQYTLREILENQDEIILDLSDAEHEQILNAYFSLIQRESGFISGLVCVLHDVTEQQKIDRERRQFVSNVSHELRTPLTSMRSYIEALNDGAWKDPEVAPQFLKVTQDETDRMIRMINDLLSLSRMDSGRLQLELELVNLNELFNYILNRFDMMLDKDNNDTRDTKTKNYTIKRDFTKRDLWVEIDTDKFIQVVDNIMNNAIKYSPDGGVITCRLLETHNHVILSITDQGLGIPKKDLNHVFDRFFRVDKARSRAQGGTGLGLAISKEVIALHHGKIWVDSIEGKGSTFYISLPYEEYEGDAWDEA